MAEPLLGPDLAQRLATCATGFAVVKDGVLDVRSVSDSPKSSALIGMYTSGRSVVTDCADPDCDCAVKALALLVPSARIVRVTVEVTNG